jgi:hypothetical protein
VSTAANPYGPPRAVLHQPSVPLLLGLFALCSLAGVAALVSLLGLMTIGVFVAPFALGLLAALAVAAFVVLVLAARRRA